MAKAPAFCYLDPLMDETAKSEDSPRETARTTVMRDPLDPRPRLVEVEDVTARLAGVRCSSCGYAVAYARPLCPACGGSVVEELFGPTGTVWSSTVVRVPTPSRTPPYGLAYVDLDGGPRVLAHAAGTEPMPVGARVRLLGLSPEGDVEVEEA